MVMARKIVVAVSIGVLFLSLAGGWWWLSGDPPTIDQVRRDLRSATAFASPEEASRSLAEISALMADDARRCASRHAADDRRCEARFAAAAYSQAMAVEVVRCNRPGIEQVRVALLRHLEPLEDGAPEEELEPAESVLVIPTCS